MFVRLRPLAVQVGKRRTTPHCKHCTTVSSKRPQHPETSSFLHQKRVTETGRSGNRNPVLEGKNVQKRPFSHRSNCRFFFIEVRIGLNRDARKPQRSADKAQAHCEYGLTALPLGRNRRPCRKLPASHFAIKQAIPCLLTTCVKPKFRAYFHRKYFAFEIRENREGVCQ